jgi:hypothetical protein
LTGVRAGRVLSRERVDLREADAVGCGGRQHRMHRQREMQTGLARSQTPRMYGNTLLENREVPWYRLRLMESQAVSGKSKDIRR